MVSQIPWPIEPPSQLRRRNKVLVVHREGQVCTSARTSRNSTLISRPANGSPCKYRSEHRPANRGVMLEARHRYEYSMRSNEGLSNAALDASLIQG